MKTILRLWLVLIFTVSGSYSAHAMISVYDAINTAENIVQQVVDRVVQAAQHAEDMAKYVQMIENQTQQIAQLTTMISQNVQQLERLGNPQTYINMLSLNTILADIQRTMNGVGTTMAEFQQTANGVMALKNTANGLYQDLSQLKDQFGNPIQFQANGFTKFGVVQNMYQSFSTEMTRTNQALANLLQQKQQILQQLNAASSLIETEKLKSQLQAVEANISGATARLGVYSQKILVQNAVNQNDAARVQEAQRQQWQQQALADDLAMQAAAQKLLAPPN
jgi:putative ubiquitin-RnfH superfamily antitoxin RatB of RatAB toxin-antitoxin module